MDALSTILTVKVSPGASRDRLGPWMADGALKIAVTAPPEAGKANAAVCKLLARKLGLPLAGVVVLHGASSSRKKLQISGLSEATIRQRLLEE